MELKQKLDEFHNAIVAINESLQKFVGGGLSLKSLSEVAPKINSIQTTKNMGSKSVTFKQNATIYGVKIVANESDADKRVVYTDDAKGMVPVNIVLPTTAFDDYGTITYNGWDKTWIFKKFYPVMLKTDGTVDYKLDPNDQTKKASGGTSDIQNQDYDGNAMVCFEKMYLKLSMSGNDETIQLSDAPLDGFEPIGFYREDKSAADKIYVGMFANVIKDTKLRSLAYYGARPSGSSYENGLKMAEANGQGYSIESHAMHTLFASIYTMLFKTSNKDILGSGRSIKYSTDLCSGLRMDSGPIALKRTVKFLYMEDYVTAWHNKVMTGFRFGGTNNNPTHHGAYIKMYPPYDNIEEFTRVPNDFTYGTQQWFVAKTMKSSNEFGRYCIESQKSYSGYESCYWVTYRDDKYDYYAGNGTGNCGPWGRVGFIANNLSGDSYVNLTYIPPK